MKRIIIAFTTLLLAIGMTAQPQRVQRQGEQTRKQFSPEEYEKRMQDFIIKKASLTDEEASKFFPLLKEMHSAMRQVDHKKRANFKHGKDLTEEECKKIILETTELELEHKKIEQKYFTKKFPTVLSWKKIMKVRWSLEQFKMEALRQFSPHRDNGQRRHERNNEKQRK